MEECTGDSTDPKWTVEAWKLVIIWSSEFRKTSRENLDFVFGFYDEINFPCKTVSTKLYAKFGLDLWVEPE